MLWRALKHVNNGFYIDVGAAWPDVHSVTKALYDRGWRGINIEPNPEMWRLLSANRQRDINLKLALSDRPGQREIQLFADTGLSTMDSGVAALHEASGYHAVSDFVEVSTLSDVCREHVGSRDVHFLKIDVEGAERQVLLGNDWAQNRPWILVIEATVPMTQVRSHEHWESIILKSNYRMAYDDGLNRFYVAAEHEELLPAFSSPPNVFDNFVLADQVDAASQAQATEASAQLADARANTAEVRAQQAETRADSAEALHRQAEARADSAEALHRQAEARADSAEALHRQAEARADSAEALHRQAEARANSAEALKRQAEARASSAETRTSSAKAHANAAELRAQGAEARARATEARAVAAEGSARQAKARARNAEARARDAKARAQKAKARLSKLKSSISWRVTKPIRAISRVLSRGLDILQRWIDRQLLPMRLQVLYQKAILYRRPWGFSDPPALRNILIGERTARFLVAQWSAKGRAAQQKIAAPLQGSDKLVQLVALLGEPGSVPDPQRISAVSSALRALDRHSEQCLARREFPAVERQAMLELEFALHLATTNTWYGRTPPPVLRSGSEEGSIYVFDARCFQDMGLRNRGVGIHAREVLAALGSMARPAGKIILLLDPTMDPVDSELAALSDRQVFSCANIDLSRVKLFVSASPMTASIGPLMPLLLAPRIRRAAVVYDFIPAEFPSNYLRSAVDRICYQARYMALHAYHAFLPISAATEVELRKRIATAASSLIVNSGVADPLLSVSDGASQLPIGLPERYVVAPSGGEPRKNLAIVIAAEAVNRSKGKKPNRIVAIGRLTERQREFILKLARRSRLPDTDIVLLSDVSSRDLKQIYRRALICVVPSFAEGFSIPAAESVHQNTAVVASDIPAHRELLGAGPWLAHPSSVADIARAMRRTIKARQRIIQLQKDNLSDRAEPNAVHDRIASLLRELLITSVADDDEYAGRHIGEAERPRIAVATPWPPQRSGVADYSRYTMEGVSAFADVTILTNERSDHDQNSGDCKTAFRMIDASAYLDPQYDRVLTVLGNSHFHLAGLEYVMNLGGPILAHDNRMLEFYWTLYGPQRTARLLSAKEVVRASDIPPLLLDLDRLPALGYAEIGRVAKPLLVHSKNLQDRLSGETEARVVKLPFVPYRRPTVDSIDREVRGVARCRRAIDENVINIATFGIVDRRTKGADVLVDAMAWLDLWKIPARLHFVGAVPAAERGLLDGLAAERAVRDRLVFHSHMDENEYSDMLLAADVAVQLRMSSVLTVSGALLDCIAFGVPTITTESMASDTSVPPFVTAIPDRISPLLVAEAVIANAERRSTALEEIESQRLAYLADYSSEQYAAALLESLGMLAEVPHA